MAGLVIRIGYRSEQGRRPNNEDRFVADPSSGLFVVADGMGGQDFGEQASGMAVEIIPQVVADRLAANDDGERAVLAALDQANQAIIEAGQNQMAGRRMGTTAVVALQRDDKVYVANLGDSRAYLMREGQVRQLTVDHTVASALVRNGNLTPEQAAGSPWSHVLYKFLGCVEMTEGADVLPFIPAPGDKLLLASDGLTNHVTDEDLIDGAARYDDPQEWVNSLVEMALERGSRDNITCIMVYFVSESSEPPAALDEHVPDTGPAPNEPEA